eukprot:4841370-Amphidinium_carterae.1
MARGPKKINGIATSTAKARITQFKQDWPASRLQFPPRPSTNTQIPKSLTGRKAVKLRGSVWHVRHCPL